MTETITKLNRDCNLSLRQIASEQKDSILNLILLTHEMVYLTGDDMKIIHVTGPKMYQCIYYFMDSFEHIYFQVNNYITTNRNLRQVNRSLWWIEQDYQKFKATPEVMEVIEHTHNFFKIMFETGLLAVEAYEALAKLKKAEEKIDQAITSLTTNHKNNHVK
jgi:hypothetical protein